MKKILSIFLLFSFLFASFSLKDAEVIIEIKENGSAQVEEVYNLIIYGVYSKELYHNAIDNDTIASWQKILNMEDFKTHISLKHADIKSFVLKPQPLRESYSLPNVWYGQIRFSYEVYPYYFNGSMVNGTGIVNCSQYKPRVKRYYLNPYVFSFKTTKKGSIIIPDKMSLKIILPKYAKIVSVNPLPKESNNYEIPKCNIVSWKGVILNNFELVYDLEISLEKEAQEFFADLQKDIIKFMLTKEGLASLFILASLFGSYFYLKKVKK